MRSVELLIVRTDCARRAGGCKCHDRQEYRFVRILARDPVVSEVGNHSFDVYIYFSEKETRRKKSIKASMGSFMTCQLAQRVYERRVLLTILASPVLFCYGTALLGNTRKMSNTQRHRVEVQGRIFASEAMVSVV